MDPQVGPLKRSWCLFELLQTFLLQQDNPAFELRLATGQGLLGLGGLRGGATDIDLALRIGEAVATLDLQDADASCRADKEMIDDLVQRSGGFDLMNGFIRTKVREVLQALRSQTEDSFSRLDDMLVSSAGSGAEVGQRAAVLPPTGPGPMSPLHSQRGLPRSGRATPLRALRLRLKRRCRLCSPDTPVWAWR